MISPEVIRETDHALDALATAHPAVAESESYIVLAQSIRRLFLLIEMERAPAPRAPEKGRFGSAQLEADARERLEKTIAPPVAPPVVAMDVNHGKCCDRCSSRRIRNKGGGCLVCLDCGFDMGCNG